MKLDMDRIRDLESGKARFSKSEIAAGWHFCPTHDGALMLGFGACPCGDPIIKVYRDLVKQSQKEKVKRLLSETGLK